jgi:hypothetical protein
MSETIFTDQINNRVTGESVAFSILYGLDSGLALSTDRFWMEYNLQIIKHIFETYDDDGEKNRVYLSHQMEDRHWRWANKASCFNSDEYEWFFLVSDGKVQCVCIIYHPKKSKVDDRDIFYIEYIAVAPWNRDSCICSRMFKGLGSIMIREVLRFSIKELNYRPGFSLHSLPQALGYYCGIGMHDFGPDASKGNMHYLEMEQQSSEGFVYG